MVVDERSDTVKMGTAALRRCVIIARPQTDIGTIRALLTERGIDATASYERPWLGARPFDTVMALLEEADLVIAVLDDPATSTNLGIELGYALARDKKILVLLPGASGPIPTNLTSTLYVRANATDAHAIAYNLDALLAAPAPQRRPQIPQKPETHAIGEIADQILGRLQTAANEQDLEIIVAEALRASGVSILSSNPSHSGTDSSFDIGVWSDDLESSVGNPLLIELKTRIPTRRDLLVVRDRVKAAARNRNVEWALVLCGEEPPDWDAATESEPPVLVLRVYDLIERLRTEGFAAIIGSLRDRAIHVG